MHWLVSKEILVPINFQYSKRSFLKLCLRDTSSYAESHLKQKINKFWNIENICSECFFYTFCASTWSGASQQTLRNFCILINSFFDDYQELVLFSLILLSSIHNERSFLAKTMGVGSYCTNIKDKLVSSPWVEYGKTTHIWLTIRRQAVSLEGLWSNTNWIQSGRAG